MLHLFLLVTEKVTLQNTVLVCLGFSAVDLSVFLGFCLGSTSSYYRTTWLWNFARDLCFKYKCT